MASATTAERQRREPRPAGGSARRRARRRTTLAEKQGDVVYTPEWVVVDMIEHFQPNGIVLDPCRGLGAFTDHLPEGSPWCEITDGRDFFEWNQQVDWVIGNPPYSLTRPWFRHSYDIADHLLYLVPLRNVFSGYGFVREIHEFGREARIPDGQRHRRLPHRTGSARRADRLHVPRPDQHEVGGRGMTREKVEWPVTAQPAPLVPAPYPIGTPSVPSERRDE
jgi:hypothetical protein